MVAGGRGEGVVGAAGSWVETSVSGGGVAGCDVDGDTSVSSVVRSFLVVGDTVVVAVETAVDAVTVAGVRLGRAVDGSACWVVLAVVTNSVACGTPGVVVVPRLGVTAGWPAAVSLVAAVEGLAVMVTLAVTGLMVDLSVIVVLIVTGTLEVVLRVVVRVMVVVVVEGVALVVDASRVVTLSAKVVGLGTAEVAVCAGDQRGGGVVVALVVASARPVAGRVVSVAGCVMTGLLVVVTTPGALVDAVVSDVSGAPGAGDCGGGGGVTGFLVGVAAGPVVEISREGVVRVVEAVAAADVAEVMTGFLVVSGGRGTSVVLVGVATGLTVSDVTSGVVFTAGLWARVDEVSWCGGRHGVEVCIVDAGGVELSVVGDCGTVVVSVKDTGVSTGFVVAGGPVDVVEVSGSPRVVV